MPENPLPSVPHPAVDDNSSYEPSLDSSISDVLIFSQEPHDTVVDEVNDTLVGIGDSPLKCPSKVTEE